MGRVQVLHETALHDPDQPDSTLWFQWCRFLYEDGRIQHGYRFISKRPGSEGAAQQAARSQARIPSVLVLEQLIRQAKREGWGDFDGERISSFSEANWAQGPKPGA